MANMGTLVLRSVVTLLLLHQANTLPSFDIRKIHTPEQLSDVWRDNFRSCNCALRDHIQLRPIWEDVSIWCFNRKTGRFRLTLTDLADFGEVLQENSTTVLFVHGWLQDRTQFAQGASQLALAFADRNYCLVDFQPLAQVELELFKEEVSPRIATHLAGFVQGLGAIGIPPKKVTLVGEGVTSHLVGHAGNILGGRLGSIIALDPLGPFYTVGPIRERDKLTLDPSDARFVQVWYGSIGQLGSSVPLGHQNVYVNGGRHPQPYCACFAKVLGSTNMLTQLCSHLFVVEVFKATFDPSVTLVATKCQSYEHFLAGRCQKHPSSRVTLDDGGISGNYFLEASCRPPFLTGSVPL